MDFIKKSDQGRATIPVTAELTGMQPVPTGSGVLDGSLRPWILTGPMLSPRDLDVVYARFEDGFHAINVHLSGAPAGAVGGDAFRVLDYKVFSVDGYDVSRDPRMPEELRAVLDVLRPWG